MVGTIISSAATTSLTVGNLAITTLNGRALALNASVTLVNTVINVPAPLSARTNGEENNMKLVKAVGAMGLAGFAAVSAQPVSAQSAIAADSGWYGGLSIGVTRSEVDDERIGGDCSRVSLHRSIMKRRTTD